MPKPMMQEIIHDANIQVQDTFGVQTIKNQTQISNAKEYGRLIEERKNRDFDESSQEIVEMPISERSHDHTGANQNLLRSQTKKITH